MKRCHDLRDCCENGDTLESQPHPKVLVVRKSASLGNSQGSGLMNDEVGCLEGGEVSHAGAEIFQIVGIIASLPGSLSWIPNVKTKTSEDHTSGIGTPRFRVGLEPPRFLIGQLIVVRRHVEAGFPGPWAGMAEAGNVASGLGLPGEVSQWPLKRYGRFMLLDSRESPGPSSEGAAASSPSWKVRPEGGKDFSY